MSNKMTAKEWVKKGITLGKLGKYEEALDAFNKAIEINPQYDLAWYNKGVTLGELGRQEEALDAYNKAIEIDPQDASAWYNKGVILGELGRQEEALDAYNKAIEIDPQYARAWYNKGVALGELGRHEEALDAFNKAIEIDPQYARAWYNKGVALGILGRYEEVLDAFNKAIEIDPQDARAFTNLAEAYFNLGDPEQASSKVNQAIKLNSKLTSALLLRGKIEIEQKKCHKAVQSFAQAVVSDLGKPLPLLWHAYARYLELECSYHPESKVYQEEIAGIIRQLEKANELFKKGNRELRVYILYFLGCFYYKTRDISEAVRTLKKCVGLKSEAPIESLARELLDNIWSYAIRPPLWRWWLYSPLHRRLRRAIFSIISLLILALLVAYPFISAHFWTVPIELPLYTAIIILLIILVLPTTERIKARDLEVELRPPPDIGPVLPPSMMEMKLKELESYPERLTAHELE